MIHPGPARRKVVKTALLGVLSGILLTAAACSPRRYMVREMTGILQGGVVAQEKDDDLEMIRDAMPANIKLLETLLAESPQDEALSILLARQYAGYTFGFLETDLARAELSGPTAGGNGQMNALGQRMSRYYLKGADYALRALQLRYPDIRRVLVAPAAADEWIRSTTLEDVPALFWYGFHLAGHINLNRDSIRALARAHLVEKTMLRVLELQPSYYYGGAHLVLMVYYASRPPLLGGDPDAAVEHYRALNAATDKRFLLNDLLYARYHLYRVQDKKTFEQILTDVVARADTITEYRLFNAIAARRAAIYLEAVDRLFETPSDPLR